MKTKENFFNYMLTVGFVFLILLFLVSMIWITRYSLNDENVVKDHVQSTKNLIDDINEVEKSVEKNDDLQVQLDNGEVMQVKYTNFDDNIIDLSYLNVNEEKGIMTLIFNASIDNYEDIYYFKINMDSTLNDKDIVIFTTQTLPKVGKIISEHSTGGYDVLMFEGQSIEKIGREQIFGKVILKYG